VISPHYGVYAISHVDKRSVPASNEKMADSSPFISLLYTRQETLLFGLDHRFGHRTVIFRLR